MDNLQRTFGQSKQNKALLQDLILSKYIKKNWNQIVGDFLESKLEFQYIVYDYCEIMVPSTTWFTEIKFYEKQILEKINKHIKYRRKITRIKLVINEKNNANKKTTFANKKNYDNMIGR